MATHVALLRAVNVGGSKRLAMADLRTFFVGLGFESVRTMLQSGNVVFASDTGVSKKLESLLEAGAEVDLDLQTEFFVRSANEWKALVQRNPFPREAKNDPSKLVVVFLKNTPPARAVRTLQSSIKGPEPVRAHGEQLHEL